VRHFFQKGSYELLYYECNVLLEPINALYLRRYYAWDFMLEHFPLCNYCILVVFRTSLVPLFMSWFSYGASSWLEYVTRVWNIHRVRGWHKPSKLEPRFNYRGDLLSYGPTSNFWKRFSGDKNQQCCRI